LLGDWVTGLAAGEHDLQGMRGVGRAEALLVIAARDRPDRVKKLCVVRWL
jgi:hypothetical protein